MSIYIYITYKLLNLKKWLNGNPKNVESKYDAKLNYFVVVMVIICI